MNNQRIKILLIILCLALVLFALDRSNALNLITFPARRVLAPIQMISTSLGEVILSPFRTLAFIRSGEQRIKNLEQRNLELQSKVSEDQALRAENADLKKQLGADISKAHFLQPAKVLGIERYLEIQIPDSGKTRVGQNVVYLDNYIGRIVKLGFGIGYVQLVTDPDSKIPARVGDSTGLALGQFYSEILLDKVSKSDTLKMDDIVMTSGIGDLTKPDLQIGKLTKTVPSGDDLFQKAQVIPNVKISDLREVYIITE